MRQFFAILVWAGVGLTLIIGSGAQADEETPEYKQTLSFYVWNNLGQALPTLAAGPHCAEETTRRCWATLMSITDPKDPRLKVACPYGDARTTGRIRHELVGTLDFWRAGQYEGYWLPHRIGAVEWRGRTVLWVGLARERSEDISRITLYELRGESVTDEVAFPAGRDNDLSPALRVCRYRLKP